MLEYIIPVLNDAVLVYNIDEKQYLLIGPAVGNVLGYSEDDFKNNPLLLDQIIHPDDAVIIQELLKTLSPPGEFIFSYRITTPQKQVKKVQEKRILFNNGESKNNIRISVIKDITENKLTNAANQQVLQYEVLWTKNNLETLINNTNDLIWSIDVNNRYIFVNTSFKQWIYNVYGIEPKAGMTVNDPDFYPQSVVIEWNYNYNRALKGETFTVNYQEADPLTNRLIDFQVSFNPIFNNTNEITGVGCFARDNSENLSTQRSLLQQNEKLKNIASLSSHELRRPAAAILGLVDVFDKQNIANPDNMEVIDHLKTVSRELDEVIRLIVNKTFIG